jgi:hypothetical protein
VGWWEGVQRRLVIRGVCDDRVNGEARAEARGVFLEYDMDGSGDAASLGAVEAVLWGVSRIADADATKCFFAEFPTQLVGHFGEDGAPEDAELGRVTRRWRKEGEGNATGETD